MLPPLFLQPHQICWKVFSHGVTAVTSVVQNNEAMVSQTSRVVVIIKLFFLLFQYIFLASGQRSESVLDLIKIENLTHFLYKKPVSGISKNELPQSTQKKNIKAKYLTSPNILSHTVFFLVKLINISPSLNMNTVGNT